MTFITATAAGLLKDNIPALTVKLDVDKPIPRDLSVHFKSVISSYLMLLVLDVWGIDFPIIELIPINWFNDEVFFFAVAKTESNQYSRRAFLLYSALNLSEWRKVSPVLAYPSALAYLIHRGIIHVEASTIFSKSFKDALEKMCFVPAISIRGRDSETYILNLVD